METAASFHCDDACSTKMNEKLTFDIEMIIVSHQSPHTILFKMTINIYVRKLQVIRIIGGGGREESLHVFIVMCIFYWLWILNISQNLNKYYRNVWIIDCCGPFIIFVSQGSTIHSLSGLWSVDPWLTKMAFHIQYP